MTLRVVIVDDHSMVREGMRLLLNRFDDIEVVAEFSSGAELLAAAPALLADLVLMDISMVGLNGLDTASKLRDEQPQMKIIMVSMHGSADYVTQALYAGASGYLIKRSAAKELSKAIELVMSGETYIDSHISRRELETYMQHVKPGELPLHVLTARQREVLQLIAEGKNTKEIAYQLGLSPKTVESHRAQLMDRLNIRDVAGLVRYAIRVGLVPVDH